MTRCGRYALGTIALALVVGASLADAQSLGDVALREAERRKQVTPGRVFTNADLAPVEPAPPSSPAASSATAESAQPADRDTGAAPEGKAGAEGPVKASPKRSEQYWRSRAKDLRTRLAQAEATFASVEAGLADIDAGPQTPEVRREREVVAATSGKLKADIGYLRDELKQFEAFAQLNNVPPDWMRDP